ncbi:MAG: AAA family ATPase [Candidatus Paceibacterota bacterium]
MKLKSLELIGFKSFAKKSELSFNTPITAIVGPNGSGKSNVAEAFRFVLGEQSIKSMRGKKGEDLIWNGSTRSPRQNRAAIKLTFDNSQKLLNVDFDEVILERVVHRDGVNEYLVNGSQVRLRDILELLAGAHIGPSGHHIISQGEADRILNTNIKERRLMIEDALGLKIYHYKKQESERKLEKTEENIKSVESLRREIAPHIKFLKKQVEKIAKAAELRAKLVALYHEYFRRESAYLNHERGTLVEERRLPSEELKKIECELARARKVLENSQAADKQSHELLTLESELRTLRARKDDLFRELGRLEGELAAEKRLFQRLELEEKNEEHRTIAWREVEKLAKEIEEQTILEKIKELVANFLTLHKKNYDNAALQESNQAVEKISKEKVDLEEALKKEVTDEEKLLAKYNELKNSLEKEKNEGRAAEREVFRLMAAQNEIASKLQMLRAREEKLRADEEEYKRELTEAVAIAGTEAIRYEEANDKIELRSVQNERRRELEKIKIRIEEMGAGGGGDIIKEHQEAEERDAFLAKEIIDLEKTSDSLKGLIAELDEKLTAEFKTGVAKINTEFQKYFAMMFGGGEASIEVIREKKRKKTTAEEIGLFDEDIETVALAKLVGEEEEGEEGIDIRVNLPRKRIKGLDMLSGGERALTSIALIFAVSQVNPPPFIILDETDAALDEANSRKYGDIIEELSKKSQLILITHNRETMSRAGVLYGVTMGSDGVSKLLSIQFAEAVEVAK